ncbi:YjbF family lipoprotein [Alkalimonas mucilaginosa]|uniref:YjbF family lipoprotein n=1 Tax=Alkalimonas mucilaginosa TaxID=3057676 RepID=A0ABU7JIW6_9GAMM|nr:YjbF family lipoprotein [Alkalimonas sp. MEB004]MEE2025647.1 YjbF family lipoprotein [Alkalimonas sp. MEB004]
MRLLCMFAMVAVLASCSGTSRIYYQDFKAALSRPADANLSLQQLQSSSFDSLYFTRDDGPVLSLALAFIEHGQQKWVSADNAYLILQHGRVVRTVGFASDLHHSTHISGDPLQYGPDQLKQAAPWLRLTDWTDASGLPLQSVFTEAEPEFLNLLEQQIACRVFVERVTAIDSAEQFENHYWFDAATGTLLQSRQQLRPQGPVYTMTFISRYARLVSPAGADL